MCSPLVPGCAQIGRAGQIGLINDNDDGDDDDVLWMARRRGRKIAGEDALRGWWGLFPMITMIKMRR